MKILKEYISSVLCEAEGDWLVKEIELIQMIQETLFVLIDHLQDKGFSLYFVDNKEFIRLKKEYNQKFQIIIYTGTTKDGRFNSTSIFMELLKHEFSPQSVGKKLEKSDFQYVIDLEYINHPNSKEEIKIFFDNINKKIKEFEEVIEVQSQQ